MNLIRTNLLMEALESHGQAWQDEDDANMLIVSSVLNLAVRYVQLW